MSNIDAAGTFARRRRAVNRLGYGATRLASPIESGRTIGKVVLEEF